MKGHKLALGLIFVLIASGCTEMTGEVSTSPSFENLALDSERVENVTGAEYSPSETYEFSISFVNMSSVVKKTSSFFTQESNFSEAPESVQSIVVALNSTSNDSFVNRNQEEMIDIDGYEARKLNSTNRSVLYTRKSNFSFAVLTEGEGLYNSTKDLYRELADKVNAFENYSS